MRRLAIGIIHLALVVGAGCAAARLDPWVTARLLPFGKRGAELAWGAALYGMAFPTLVWLGVSLTALAGEVIARRLGVELAPGNRRVGPARTGAAFLLGILAGGALLLAGATLLRADALHLLWGRHWMHGRVLLGASAAAGLLAARAVLRGGFFRSAPSPTAGMREGAALPHGGNRTDSRTVPAEPH